MDNDGINIAHRTPYHLVASSFGRALAVPHSCRHSHEITKLRFTHCNWARPFVFLLHLDYRSIFVRLSQTTAGRDCLAVPAAATRRPGRSVGVLAERGRQNDFYRVVVGLSHPISCRFSLFFLCKVILEPFFPAKMASGTVQRGSLGGVGRQPPDADNSFTIVCIVYGRLVGGFWQRYNVWLFAYPPSIQAKGEWNPDCGC